jgi:hypothetical protein
MDEEQNEDARAKAFFLDDCPHEQYDEDEQVEEDLG